MSGPAVSVIIPAHNSAPALPEVLRALATPAGPFEIIVVDDGSTDDTAALVSRLALPVTLRLSRQPQRGRAAARNRGAGEAAAPVLLFVDADVQPRPGLIAAHLRHHIPGSRIAIQGRILPHPDALRTTFMRATHLLPAPAPPGRRLFFGHVATANFSVAAAPFHEVGGFDESFAGFGWEDIELGLRLARAGVGLRYEPAATVYHRHVEDLPGRRRKFRQAGAGAVYFWRKHRRSAALGVFLEIHPLMLPWKWLVYRTGVIGRLVEAVRPWAERRPLLPLCAECYNYLLWQDFYEGVFAARRGAGEPG
jgi:GT2 family glycosyltransferase